jgi:hypothetical protein
MKLHSLIMFAALPMLMLGCPEPETGGGGPAPAAAPPSAPQVPAGKAPGTQDGAGAPGGPGGSDTTTPEAGVPPLGEGVAAPAPVEDDGVKPDTPPPGEEVHPCGDGQCDDVETGNPKLCPRDCGAETPAGGDWCGDGVCDALEEDKGICAKDCKK